MTKKELWYWNKYDKILLLEKKWFNIPKFYIYSDKEEYKINLQFPLILRSSFSWEDGDKYSFAGIFHSYYPINSKKDLKSIIKNKKLCPDWKKLDIYKPKELASANIIHNYIIQEFIVWDISWVIFSKYEKKYIRIEFIPWLNFPLTDWIASPNIYLFDRNNFDNFIIDDIYIENFSFFLNNEWKILKKYIIIDYESKFMEIKNNLLKMTLDIEKIFWYPQDIEFTVKNNDIYILQTRNITTNGK